MRAAFNKKIFCTILVCIIFLCGCGKKETKTIIEFASWGSKSETDILKPLLSEFEQENPNIKVDFMHIPQNYFQKIHLLYPQPLEALSWKGKLYAIPRDVSNLVIYYNKDLFNKKHIAYPDKNWTFEDFLTTAQKLTDKNTFGISFEEDPLFYLPYLMSSGGGILPDEISKPESQNAITFYADLRKKYHAAPLKSESASATMAQMFLQQRIGMYLSGRWMVPKLREEAEFDWDIAQFPKGTKGSIVQLDASGWAVSKQSVHKNEAKKLIEFLSSKESSEKFAQSGLIVPAREDAANSAYFLDGKKPENAKIFLDIIKTSKPTPVTIDYREITDKLKKDTEARFN